MEAQQEDASEWFWGCLTISQYSLAMIFSPKLARALLNQYEIGAVLGLPGLDCEIFISNLLEEGRGTAGCFGG